MRPVLSVLITLLVGSFVHSSERAPLTVCYEDQHTPPFWLGVDAPQRGEGGILTEYLFLTAERLNQPLIFQRMPWKRCLSDLMHGKVDATFAMIYTDERDQWAAYPKSNGVPDNRYLYNASYPVFVSLQSELQWDGTAFTPENVIVQSVPGYVAERKLMDMGLSPVLDLQPKDALPLLVKNRLDGYIVESLIGQSLLKELGLNDQIIPLAATFLEQPWYLTFSKQRYAADPASVEEFWTVLNEIRQAEGAAITDMYLNR